MDLVEAPDAPAARNGLGTVHHVAFAIGSAEEQLALRRGCSSAGCQVTEVRDRTYFQSIYFREPGGVLFEVATTAPGFAVDEAPDRLGTRAQAPAVGGAASRRDRGRAAAARPLTASDAVRCSVRRTLLGILPARPASASNLTVRVLVAIALGVLVGALWPSVGRAMKPLGDTFVNLVRMVIAPIIFLTIVLGVAHTSDLKRVGRVGLKAFVYFEVVTTFALAIGLVVMNLVRPGEGIDAVPRRLGRRGGSSPPRASSSASSTSSPTSCRRAWSARSPRATSCRWCSSRSCSAWRSPRSAARAGRWRGCSSG